MIDPTTISEGRKRSLANLKRWPKGQCGNPAGRPKGRSFTDICQAKFQQPAPQEIWKKFSKKPLTWAEVFAEYALRRSLGKIPDMDKVLDRVEGKPTQKIDMNATVERPTMLFDPKKLTTEQLEKIIEIATGMKP